MFRDTGAFLDELRDFLRNSASFMTFFSTVLAMKIPALHHDPLFEAVSNAQRQVQARVCVSVSLFLRERQATGGKS